MSPQSYANLDPQNLELTPCRVTWNGNDLGGTLGNVSIKIETELSDLKADQLGTSVIDRKVSGQKYSVEFEIAEVKNKDLWKILFPMNNEVTSGSKAMYFDSQIGYSMVSGAAPLLLHPLSLPNSDTTQDFYFWLTAANAKSEYVYSPTDQTKLKVVFDVYPDFTAGPPRYFFFGDLATGLVAASAGSATAATGNVGNGTVGSITVYSGFTATETVTLQCVTAGTGGSFYISGSSSGALGLASLGVTFNSDQISFTISGGGTPFAVNDSFQIATVSANYV